jgi:hypothetical protein
MLLNWLKTLGAVGTIVTGAISLIRPLAVTGFTGIQPDGPRGLSEIRGVLGGLFIALGGAALLLPDKGASQAAGLAYLGTAGGRLLSIIIDKAYDRSNWISLVWEVFFGVVLVI